MVKASQPGEHGGSGVTYSFDITEIVRGLTVKNQWNPASLRVSFYPHATAADPDDLDDGQVVLRCRYHGEVAFLRGPGWGSPGGLGWCRDGPHEAAPHSSGQRKVRCLLDSYPMLTGALPATVCRRMTSSNDTARRVFVYPDQDRRRPRRVGPEGLKGRMGLVRWG